MHIKPETDYKTIEYEIVKLDRQIILHITKRIRYKELACKLQPDRDRNSVADFRSMLDNRKQWALNIGLNPNIVNKLSQYLIDYYLTDGKYTQKQI